MAPGVVFLRWRSLVAARLGSGRTRCIQDHGSDFFRLRARAGRDGMESSRQPASAVVVTFGNWFAVHDYRFPLVLMADRLSLPFLAMTVVLSGLIGQFSATYLHRESGFFRFFLLLHLFAFGSLLAFAAGSFDLLARGMGTGGHHVGAADRFLPTASGSGRKRSSRLRRVSRLRHRIAGGRLRHASMGRNASFAGGFPMLTGTQATVVCLFLLLAAAGKAAQVPFSGWLPRAMEGPTPSSAIFYGAISIHAGAYLLLRVQPLLAQSPRGLRSGDPDRRGHSHPRHHRRPRQRGRQNLARLRLADAGRRGLRGDRNRMDIDRRGAHPGARHGSHPAVPARAVDASRLSPDALRHRRRSLTTEAFWRICLPERVRVVALPVGARPRSSRHDSRPLGSSIRFCEISQAVCQSWMASARTAARFPCQPAEQGRRMTACFAWILTARCGWRSLVRGYPGRRPGAAPRESSVSWRRWFRWLSVRYCSGRRRRESRCTRP